MNEMSGSLRLVELKVEGETVKGLRLFFGKVLSVLVNKVSKKETFGTHLGDEIRFSDLIG